MEVLEDAGRWIIAALVIVVWPTRSSEAQTTTWTYGGFADVGYLFAPNDPFNGDFRSRGTRGMSTVCSSTWPRST